MAVVVVGTLDTKGEEIGFARDVIAAQGVDVHVVNTGVMGEPAFEPDTTASEVARAAGTTLEALREDGDRGAAVEAMGDGAAEIAKRLHDEGVLEGIFGLGGSGNTSIATAAMRALPVGVPKLVVSTMGSGDTSPYVGTSDVGMLYSVADIEGLNQLSSQVIANGAAAIAGMVDHGFERDAADEPTIGLTMLGVTTPCVQTAREHLEQRGYETIVFQANGQGGRTMEDLIEEGIVDGVLDVSLSEWADEIVGGEFGAGPDRLKAAGEAGIPQVVSLGGLDMAKFGPMEEVPERFRDRHLHVHNPQVTLMRTTPEECAEFADVIAEKLNAATGPTAVAIPRGGVSMLDAEGEEFHDPEADERLFERLRENLDDHVEVIDMDANINDEAFATRMAETLEGYLS